MVFVIKGKYGFKRVTIIFDKPYYVKAQKDLTLENDKLRNKVITLAKEGDNNGHNK